jgi:hypothetical protein
MMKNIKQMLDKIHEEVKHARKKTGIILIK